MSFSRENFTKKLSSLQETQDSIVSISQWALFHHRNSKEIAEVWSDYTLSKSVEKTSGKRLSLLYLCNDVVQQARHKRKSEFIREFANVLPNVLNIIFHALEPNIKPKVERLIGVWEQRQVFSNSEIKLMKEALKNSGQGITNDNDKPSKGSDLAIVPELKLLNDLFLHLNQLVDISQNNLNQVGLQSKTYLPSDPLMTDNLPSPNIYISKLNILEKLCNVCNKNIDEIKGDRMNIIKNLDNLKKIMEEGLKTDESKRVIINSKYSTLTRTRNELKEMIDDDQESEQEEKEETSPTFDKNNDDSNNTNGEHNTDDGDIEDEDEDEDDAIPTYNDDDSDEEESPPIKKIKKSPSFSSTPPSNKKVAFSDNVEIKEYDRENQTEIIKIIKSDDDQTENEDNDINEEEVSQEFTAHHKDDLELSNSNNGHDNYDPSSNAGSEQTSVLDLLTKLQQN